MINLIIPTNDKETTRLNILLETARDKSIPLSERIRVLAYKLHLNEPDNDAMSNWLQAEDYIKGFDAFVDSHSRMTSWVMNALCCKIDIG